MFVGGAKLVIGVSCLLGELNWLSELAVCWGS